MDSSAGEAPAPPQVAALQQSQREQEQRRATQVQSLQAEPSEARSETQQALRQVQEAKFAFRFEGGRRILRETMTELASRAASSSRGDEEDSTPAVQRRRERV